VLNLDTGVIRRIAWEYITGQAGGIAIDRALAEHQNMPLGSPPMGTR
jgi:hypothetical protein